MLCPEESKPCLKKALNRLGRGDLTARQMLEYLTAPRPGKIPFERERALGVIRLLIQEGYLDDGRYLALVLEKLDGALCGPRKICEELKKKKFSARAVEAALARDIDYTARATAFLSKRAGAAQLAGTPEGRKKLVSAVVRRGFDFSDAYQAVSALAGEEADSDGKDF